MGGVTVGTHRGVDIALGHSVEVHAVQGTGVVLEMAPPARLILCPDEVAAAVDRQQGVRIVLIPLVAVDAVKPVAVSRLTVGLDIEIQGELLPAWKRH
jgi:hypothetical protein